MNAVTSSLLIRINDSKDFVHDSAYLGHEYCLCTCMHSSLFHTVQIDDCQVMLTKCMQTSLPGRSARSRRTGTPAILQLTPSCEGRHSDKTAGRRQPKQPGQHELPCKHGRHVSSTVTSILLFPSPPSLPPPFLSSLSSVPSFVIGILWEMWRRNYIGCRS